MNARALFAILASTTPTAALLGCGGGGASGTTMGAGGTTSSSATSTGTGGAGTGGAGTGGAGTGGAGTGGEVSCSMFAPTPPVPMPVAVRLTNMTGSSIYVGPTMVSCDFDLGFAVEDANSNMLKAALNNCDFTCVALQSGACSCPPCGPQVVTLIAPGKYYEIPWPGTVFNSESMPAACYKEAACAQSDATCFIETLAPMPPLTFTSSAYTQALGCVPGPCLDCNPGAGGNCSVSGATTVGGTELHGELMWMGGATAEIDFM